MQKNVTGQYWYVFAFDITDNTPKTGDAGNITGDLYLDNGGANAIDDTNPTELANGFYRFDIAQAESNADQILIDPVSATGSIQVVGAPASLFTTAPNANTLGIEADGDLTKCNLVAVTSVNSDMYSSTMRGTDGVDTSTMRGTDGANTTAPNTVVPDPAGTAPTLAEIFTTALTEAYSAKNAAPTLAQALCELLGEIRNFVFSSTTQTIKKLDGSTTAYTNTIDDADNPTSKVRGT